MWRAAALLLGVLLMASSGRAEPVPCATPLTAVDAEAWMDGFMPFALQRGAIPGAVVAIVKDGHVLFEKGYGVADAATGRAVDPRTTLFRIGSISKLFTWTAVMQLVEQRRIDLDADVNIYLDFKIPPRRGQPVTMRNLMTHTAGFEEATRGIATQDPNDPTRLGQALARWVPTRVFDAGTTPAYSNYGAALAGYIVERVSHERFADYVGHHILGPLGMSHSTFVQPLPPALAPDMAKGYVDGNDPPQPFETVVWSPAGGISTTGDDMARFMLAHLGDGRLGAAQILRPETARMMHTTALTILPPLARMDLGFYEMNINGRRVIGHDGATVAFHALLGLYLDEHVGLFVALNAMGRDGANRAVLKGLFQGFSDRYFPGPPPPSSRVGQATAHAHAKMFAGSYATTRRPFSSFLAGAFFLGQVGVTANADGTISADGLDSLGGAPKRFRETTPFLWSEVGGHDRLAVRRENGRITAFANDEDSPSGLYQSIPTWRSARWLEPAAGVALLVILITVLGWPAGAVVRRYYGVRLVRTRGQIAAYRITALFGLIALAAAAGWAWVLSLLFPPTGIFLLASHALGIHLVQLLSVVGWPGGMVAALIALAMIRRTLSPWHRAWAVLLVSAFAVLTWTGSVCHLLGFGLDY